MAKRGSKGGRSERLPGLGGASDRESGGGAGSGVPDAELQMRTGGRAGRGDVEADRAKLFPELAGRKSRRKKASKRPRTQGGSAGGVSRTK